VDASCGAESGSRSGFAAGRAYFWQKANTGQRKPVKACFRPLSFPRRSLQTRSFGVEISLRRDRSRTWICQFNRRHHRSSTSVRLSGVLTMPRGEKPLFLFSGRPLDGAPRLAATTENRGVAGSNPALAIKSPANSRILNDGRCDVSASLRTSGAALGHQWVIENGRQRQAPTARRSQRGPHRHDKTSLRPQTSCDV